MSTTELRVRITAQDRASAALGRTRAGVESISRQLELARNAFLGFQAAVGLQSGVAGLAALTDEVRQVDARLRQVTRSTADFAAAQRQALALSAETGAGYRAIADLYSRLAISAADYGVSQEQLAAVTEITARALRVSGASAAETASVITQLSQGLGAGALRGEEFNAVMESGPRLARALADGLGVPIGRLRELAEQGLLTTDVVVQALLSQRAALAREAAAMPQTIGAALTALRDAFGQTAARIDATTGASVGAVAALSALARHLDAIVAVGIAAALAAGAVAMGRLAAATTAAIGSLAAKLAAERQALAVSIAHTQARVSYAAAELAAAQAAVASATGMARLTLVTTALIPAQQRLAAASAAATAALAAKSVAARGAGAALAFMGGKLGLVVTALTAGTVAWTLWGSRASAAADQATAAIERAREAAARLAREQRFGAGDEGVLREGIAALEARIAALVQSSGRSPGARQQLGAARAELEQLQAQLDRLERSATAAPGAPSDAARELARRQWQAYITQFRDRGAQLQAAIDELRARAREAGVAESSAEFQRALAQLRARHAPRVERALGETFDDVLARMAQRRLELHERAEADASAAAERERAEAAAEASRRITEDFEARRVAGNELAAAERRLHDTTMERHEAVARRWADALEPGRAYLRQLDEIDEAELRGALSAEHAAQARARVAAQAERTTLAYEGTIAAQQRLDDMTRQLGITFTSAFENAIVHGRRLSEVLHGLGQDILRILVRRNITEPVAAAVGSVDWRSVWRWFGFAAGGVPGGASLAAWRNRIVDRPTLFAFARGGVMGEAGPEAIMPLTRGPGGRLGVDASGAGVTVNVINQAAGTRASASERTGPGGRRIIDVVIDEVRASLSADIARGAGPVPAALASTYGLSRAAGAWR